MIAVVKTAPGAGHVELVERERRTPGPREVEIRVTGAGVCGTDLHIVLDEYQNRPPVTLGHEVAGVVSAAGPSVDRAWVGQRVVTETYYSTCERCDHCRSGHRNLCPERASIGSMVDGGFAHALVVPASNLHPIPDWLDAHAAALAEPLACVANALCDPPVVCPGDRVLVVGPGPVGLLAAQVARAAGGTVLISGMAVDEERLDVARALGFDTSVAGAAASDAGPVADVVVECSGSAAGMAAGLRAARPTGRFVQLGIAGRDVSIPIDEICYRELTLTSGFASTPLSWRRAMRLIESRAVQLDPLVTDVVPLRAWPDVLDRLRLRRGVKYVFDPRLD